MRTLLTIQGDTADQIAMRAYGSTASVTEAILDANPQLCAAGPVLVEGIVVQIPDVATPAPATTIQLWD